ncbi:MAG: ABC transporter ATP-binding protein [Ignavibacteriae bacterium]|nr:ABC transporter ATP-binding protein [Ignavibacteriota bacterium]
MNILEIDDLRKTYEGGYTALDGLTLSVRKGILFGFLGLNGAGKTTTIRILAGLNSRNSGMIKMFGAEITEHDYDHKQRIGFVLDEPLYFDWMSAGEYLRFVGTMYDLPPTALEHRVPELLEFFDLTEKGDDAIETFSTGMKKKVSLAAAIIHKPELIILDEPLEGIDALAASSIKESLKMMAASGTTIFITSHVLDTVERLCDEIAIVHQGKVLMQCMTAEIRTKVKSELANTTYDSLEDLFVDLVSDRTKKKHLSWL